ncbi:MAG: DnaJ domain-containing protein, partial [Proteobacteria bacterium]|nr:DnaJ domain-containing protein [Pseudomonadota bacterium]
YDQGQGIPQDYAEAAKWYRKAAEQGNAEAQVNLGLMYVLGQGVPKNDVNAYAWLSLAAAQGNEEAAKSRDSISYRLSPKQRSQGQALASKLQAKIGKPAAQAEKATPASPPTVTANEPQLKTPGSVVESTGQIITKGILTTFDIKAARVSGYSDKEIASYLAEKNGYDYDSAVKAGYNDTEIAEFLSDKESTEERASIGEDIGSHVTPGTEQAAGKSEKPFAVIPFFLLILIGVAILSIFLWIRHKTIAAKSHTQDESKSHRQQTAPPHESIKTHYDRLKVARDAPPEVIAAAYRSLSKIHHPDRNPGNAEAATIMALINASYDILSDPDKRRQYDLWLQQHESEAHTTYQTEAAQKIKTGSLFFAQLLRYWIPFGLAALFAFIWLTDKPSQPPPGQKPYLAAPPPTPPPVNPPWVRPTTAPNGQPWPTSAAYIKGYKLLHTDGLSTVTIDNSQNDSDVFVKLVSLDNPQVYPVRQFFIPVQRKFKMKKVTAGSYDIRYRDLDSGGLARSESFRLKEEQTNNGTRYSNITMTLYKVRDGNMNTFALSEEEF